MPPSSRNGRHLIRAVTVVAGLVIALPLLAGPAGASGPTWTTGSIPSGSASLVGGLELVSVSCVSTHFCVAVGSMGADEVIDVFHGTSWTESAIGAPLGFTYLFPESVSCVSVTSCVVVGEAIASPDASYATAGFAQRLTGSKWSTTLLASQGAWGVTALDSVSCVADVCRAIGTGSSASSADTTIEAVTTGQAWTVSGLGGINVTYGGDLTSLSCTSATWCAAVGSDESAGVVLAETLDGTTWSGSATSIPATSRFFSTDDGYLPVPVVSCAATGSCVATVNVTNSVGPKYSMLADTLSAGTWTLTSPEGAPSAGLGVSCVSQPSIECQSVGSTSSTNGATWVADAATDVSGTWSTQAVSLGSSTDTAFGAISCVTHTWCVAVGSADRDQSALLATWSGSTVRAQVQAHADTPQVVPHGVTCPSSDSCTVVAVQPYAIGPTPDLITSDGHTWSIHTVVVSTGTSEGLSAEFSSVSCSGGLCAAVGSVGPGDGGNSGAVVDVHTSAGWSVHVVQVPSGFVGGALSSVDCPSSTSCVAVGFTYELSDAQPVPLVDTYAAGTWTTTTLSAPGARAARLASVSCPSIAFCLAVGESGGADTSGLQATWSDGGWTTADVPSPPGDAAVALTGVSCASATYCVATERATPTSRESTVAGAVDVWTGHWSSPTASYSAGAESAYDAVDCPTTTSCVAVGYAGSSVTSEAPLVAVQSAGGWRTSVLHVPTGDSSVALDAVSCWSADHCLAVGPASLKSGGESVATETVS